MEYLEIGPVPSDESCQQVGTASYDSTKARAECRAFANQIARVCGAPPFGAKLVVKSNPHDFGTYHEVAVKYDDSEPEAVDYAMQVESTSIPNWDSHAKLELGI